MGPHAEQLIQLIGSVLSKQLLADLEILAGFKWPELSSGTADKSTVLYRKKMFFTNVVRLKVVLCGALCGRCAAGSVWVLILCVSFPVFPFLGVPFPGVPFLGVSFPGFPFLGVPIPGVPFLGVSFPRFPFLGVPIPGVPFTGILFTGVPF